MHSTLKFISTYQKTVVSLIWTFFLTQHIRVIDVSKQSSTWTQYPGTALLYRGWKSRKNFYINSMSLSRWAYGRYFFLKRNKVRQIERISKNRNRIVIHAELFFPECAYKGKDFNFISFWLPYLYHNRMKLKFWKAVMEKCQCRPYYFPQYKDYGKCTFGVHANCISPSLKWAERKSVSIIFIFTCKIIGKKK